MKIKQSSPKEILIEESNIEELESINEKEVNWLEGEFWNEWGIV